MPPALLKICGYFFTLLALIGIVLPLVPTTPFALVALACFTRSDPKMRAWLWNHPWMGPYIQDWQRNQIIRRSAKWRASLVIAFSCAMTMAFAPIPHWGKIALVILLVSIIAFIVTRRESPEKNN